MNFDIIKSGLSEYDQYHVERYINYCGKLLADNKQEWWMKKRSEKQLIDYFKAVSRDGLVLDGEDITLISTGVSYNYVAYRNKMLLSYPESVIDLQLVYDGDSFRFKKESGKILYTHEIANPFDDDKEKKIMGGYCIIKNNRGEFLTTLSKAEIEKHRKVAKTDAIWSSWLIEMCLKTVIKKGCKQHFKDIYGNIETIDNENYDLGQPLGITVETKSEIEEIKTLEDLEKYYRANIDKNAGVKKDFNKAVSARKAQIEEELKNETS